MRPTFFTYGSYSLLIGVIRRRPQPTGRQAGDGDKPAAIARYKRKALSGLAHDILLHDLQRVTAYRRHNCHVPELCVGEYQQIVWLRLG